MTKVVGLLQVTPASSERSQVAIRVLEVSKLIEKSKFTAFILIYIFVRIAVAEIVIASTFVAEIIATATPKLN